MELFSIVTKVFLTLFGLLFLLIGVFIFLRSIPKYTIGSYIYITEDERVKRSATAGLSVILVFTGFIMIASGLLPDTISFKSLFGIFAVVILSLPFGVMAGLSTYNRLGTFTKTKDDIVFLDDHKRPKN